MNDLLGELRGFIGEHVLEIDSRPVVAEGTVYDVALRESAAVVDAVLKSGLIGDD